MSETLINVTSGNKLAAKDSFELAKMAIETWMNQENQASSVVADHTLTATTENQVRNDVQPLKHFLVPTLQKLNSGCYQYEEACLVFSHELEELIQCGSGTLGKGPKEEVITKTKPQITRNDYLPMLELTFRGLQWRKSSHILRHEIPELELQQKRLQWFKSRVGPDGKVRDVDLEWTYLQPINLDWRCEFPVKSGAYLWLMY